MDEIINRRKFLKFGLFGVAGLSIPSFLNSCATPLIEAKEDVANIKWDSNPAISVPNDGCYIGWHNNLAPVFLGANPMQYVKHVGQEDVNKSLGRFKEYYGKKPAVMSFFDRHVTGEWFPYKVCEALDNNGVIPLIRYYFTSSFKRVANGEYDGELVKFAENARKFGKPFLFIPYPEANIKHRYIRNVHPWAGKSGKDFRKAWKHMHHVLEEEGLNEYAVWGLHLIAWKDSYPLDRHALEDDLFDWMGFTVYNHVRKVGSSHSFGSLFNYGYSWARSNYPNKPIALWEFATSSTSNQGRWIKKAYQRIKKMPRIKLVVYAEYEGGSTLDSVMISFKSRSSFREAISDPYFIDAKI
jgi:hypothetical protein